MSGSLGHDSIIVINATLSVDPRHNTETRRWATATETPVLGCSVQPFEAAEDDAGREYARTRLKLFAPPTAPLVATSRVRFAGKDYEVDGEPGLWRDGGGPLDHIQAVIKLRTG